MVIRVKADQIPKVWEAIKFACVNADEVPQEHIEGYLTNLLRDLMSSIAVCWLRRDTEDRIQAIMITRVIYNKITDIKHLHIDILYSFSKVPDDEWKQDIEIIKDHMREEGCKWAEFNSRNRRIWSLAESVGFAEKHRTYRLGGA